jgi:AcrR family transcriptional regulator
MPKVIDEEKVFQAVIDIFVTGGYENATTKKIASAAGIHEATLFRKYGNKAELFEQAVEYQLADTPLSRVNYSGELKTDLLGIVNAYIETNESHGDIIPTIISQIPRHPELKNMMTKPWANLQPILDIVRQYQANGLLRKESPLTTISVLIMVSQMLRRAVDDLPIPPFNASEYVEYFLQGRSTPG